ncbi:G-protein coupled receptor daf-37-like [Littorina saxatilis]|uniref:G-protein coupled receptors family 1 profile domain-containing protein n=2 Tax=Littorina saxatilis TaxID=31220 RepID=A0AAN9BV42_9CAEN
MATSALLQALTTTLTTSLNPVVGDAIHPTSTDLLTSLTTTTLPPALPPGGGRPPPPDFLLHTQFVVDRVLIPLVVTFGIVGNFLSLVVLTRKEMASPTNSFLTALAISDISLLLLQVPMFFGLNPSVASTDSFKLFVRYYTVIMYVMTNVFLTCTCWLTVAVTVERFLSLRFMMHPRLVCTIRRAKRAILAIFFASFLFHFSKFFEYVPNTDLSSPRPLLPTELSLNKAYDVAMHITNITLATLLPIVALIVFNSFLVYFLATHRRRMLRHKTKAGLGLGGGSSGGGGSTSVDMLHVSGVVIAVVLVFVLCHSLGVVVALNIAVHGRHKIFSDHLFVAFKHVNNLLVMVNSGINFLLYCSISRKFRKMFAAVFCKRFLGKSSSWSLPVPLSENSMATAVSVRTHHAANGYSRSNDHSGSAKEASFVRPSPSNSSAASRRSADHVEI